MRFHFQERLGRRKQKMKKGDQVYRTYKADKRQRYGAPIDMTFH